ncbi:hypothetical protein EB837_08465 [Kluyvera ascorbata]|uniref:Uncharacterized protein n=1 Tax=Kluyvera ascorbata TaxID=51288 RepID=A0A3N2S850_9ENTR|nr:hypothetical protein EB837_08465 [Kluyvera ascorbata]
MKCPSCPTICQQNVKTSIQLSGICIEGENGWAKIKKTPKRYFQQRNLCYGQEGRVIHLIICNIQRLTISHYVKNLFRYDDNLSD